MYFEFGGGSDSCQFSKRNIPRSSTPKTINDFAIIWPRIANIDNRLIYFRARIAERAKNSAPIWIAAAPARAHERTVGNRTRGPLGIPIISRPAHMQRDETRNAFPIAHDHLGQLKSDEVERLLKYIPVGRDSVEPSILRKPVREHDDRIVRAPIAVDRDAIEALRDGD